MIEDYVSSGKSEVDIELEQQRNESDARSIINEVERLNTFEGEHKFRWIWELIQNARDEAGDGVDIVCELKNSHFSFSHNGQPFRAGNLLALTRRTSTKPINGSKGNAGKFGTGFITSHLLNKVVKIKGVYENSNGRKRFELLLDRTPDDLGPMMASVSASIQSIRVIDTLPAESGPLNNWNTFEYQLNGSGNEYANGGISQLEQNLPFALLVNPKIKTLSIATENSITKYSIEIPESANEAVSFAQVRTDAIQNDCVNGLLYKRYGKLIIAVGATLESGKYTLVPTTSKTKIYKELPLIGTEGAFLPVIIQHEDFQPIETRDGVRTKTTSDENEQDDPKAKKNRDSFRDLISAYPKFIMALQEAQVKNLHLLAESGYPPNLEAYYGEEWYQNEVLQPLRSISMSFPLVSTVSGEIISIRDAAFPMFDSNYNELLYQLISKLYPGRSPVYQSLEDWVRIISEDPENWPKDIIIDTQYLVNICCNTSTFNDRFKDHSEKLDWLQNLITYLEQTHQERLGIENPIYPTQNNGLSKQAEIFNEVDIPSQFKKISAGLGRVLEDELLCKGFKATYIQDFNTKDFLVNLNNEIGALKPETATQEQIIAILNICCTFKPTKAERREQWYSLINRLLPVETQERVVVDLTEEYSWDPAERWTLKFIANLIQSEDRVEKFTSKYFQESEELAFNWLNDFLDFVFRNEENREAGLRYRIIPTQDGQFRSYGDSIHRESTPSKSADKIKALYRDYSKKGDPNTFLAHLKITNENIRAIDLKVLSRAVDDLFNARETEDLVKEGQEYHSLFLLLKEWVEENPNAEDYFPIFSKKQPILYIKAFGEGSSLGRLLKLKKSVDDIEKLDNLGLTYTQMKELDDAVLKIGSADSLIQKAHEMAQQAEEIRWRKAVGNAAEAAFLAALAEAAPSFPKPDNPDDGKDFVIVIGESTYSIEIKSAVEGKETVKMSIKQGETAVKEKDSYALCVISRPAGELTTTEQFIERAKFVVDIGEEIDDKITKWKAGISDMEKEEGVSVKLESTAAMVNIKKSVWVNSRNFHEFVDLLKQHFKLTVS